MIHIETPIRVHTQDEFHRIDHMVTGQAFAIHNELGRFLDERLYQRELAARCQNLGLNVQTEARITVSFQDYMKDYSVDLLVDDGVVVETKTVQMLAGAHRGQTYNYLFLCETHHGTLLNFRPEKVQHEFISTHLTSADRRRFSIHTNAWRPLGSEWNTLREIMESLLCEWGAFLDPFLYRGALTHFLGGVEKVMREVTVATANGPIGEHKMHLLSPTAAFTVTTGARNPEKMAEHQRRFLQHTPLEAIAWINLNRHDIEFRTITK